MCAQWLTMPRNLIFLALHFSISKRMLIDLRYWVRGDPRSSYQVYSSFVPAPLTLRFVPQFTRHQHWRRECRSLLARPIVNVGVLCADGTSNFDRLNARKSLRRRTRQPDQHILPVISSLHEAQSQTRRDQGQLLVSHRS